MMPDIITAFAAWAIIDIIVAFISILRLRRSLGRNQITGGAVLGLMPLPNALRIALVLAWTIISLVICGTLVTDVEISNAILKRILEYVLIAGVVIFITNRFDWKPIEKFVAGAFIFATIVVGQHMLEWGGPWKVQTVRYANQLSENQTIEFQMKDLGAFGYSRRTVSVTRFGPFILPEQISELEIDALDPNEWKEVNIDVNEAGLKGG